jgi:hypothetical protein
MGSAGCLSFSACLSGQCLPNRVVEKHHPGVASCGLQCHLPSIKGKPCGSPSSCATSYRLRAGLAVEGAPEDTRISWAGHAALIARTVAAPSQVTMNRSIARAFTFAKPGEHQDLRGF